MWSRGRGTAVSSSGSGAGALIGLRLPSDASLFLTLPLAIAAVQVVVGGVDLLLAIALDALGSRAPVTTYGTITAVASLFALVAYPIAGVASDRTPERYGRRSAWVAVGAASSVAGLIALGQAGDVLSMGAAYVLAFASLPVASVALYATIADRVAPARRGAIGGLVGSATIAGGVAGNLLAASFVGAVAVGALVFALVLAVGAAAFVLLSGERSADGRRDAEGLRPSHGTRADLAWFSVGRFAVFLGYATVTGLAYYALRDRVGLADPASGVAAFALVSGVATLLASVLVGPWSDRAGRRRPFVVGAGLAIGIGCLVASVAPTLPAFLAAGALVGLGFGAYLAAGTALATLVLPSASTSGRDIGLVGFSNAAAQVVAPFGGAMLAAAAGYPALFALAACACLVGSLAVLRIRSVR